jgi:hypothetical protein
VETGFVEIIRAALDMIADIPSRALKIHELRDRQQREAMLPAKG